MKTASAIPTLALVLLAGGTALARPHKRVKRPRPAPAAGSEAEGRSHLKKANALASHNDCEAAIEEYTQAFDRLNDPAVLLARADCRQKIGQNAEAVEDYRAYLDESPDVANRADIEAKIEKIAALEGAPAKTAPAKAAPANKEPPAKESVAAREPPQTKEAPRPKEPARPPESPPAPAAAPPPVPPAAEAEEGPGAQPLVGAAVVTREGPAAEARPAGGHARLWLWTALAVVVAGGAATAGYFYFRPEPATPPATSLGNYRF